MIRFLRLGPDGPRVVTVPRWAVGLALGAATLVGLLMLLLAAGLALVAIPVALAAGGVAHWLGRRARPAARPQPPGVIDAEYRVIGRDEQR